MNILNITCTFHRYGKNLPNIFIFLPFLNEFYHIYDHFALKIVFIEIYLLFNYKIIYIRDKNKYIYITNRTQ